MKTFLKNKIWPVLAGLLTAFITMMLFEYVNSFIYPLPEGLDVYDSTAVKAFTASLPWTAYVLVFLGWVFGSFKGGFVTSYFAKEATYKQSFILGLILTVLGVINNVMIGHDLFFNIIGLPMFIVFTYLGHKYYRKYDKGGISLKDSTLSV